MLTVDEWIAGMMNKLYVWIFERHQAKEKISVTYAYSKHFIFSRLKFREFKDNGNLVIQ